MYSARVIGCDFITLLTLAAERLLATTMQKDKHRRPPVTLWMSKRVAYNKSYRSLTFAKRTVTIYYNVTCSWF